MPNMQIRDASLFVQTVGDGYPILLMHGGPGADHWTLWPLRRLADRFTLVLYDHRCNGRSEGADVSSMTFENLTADAEALREKLGLDKWAVLGHSFGGNVALEYALRYPASLSHLILMDTGGDQRWPQQNSIELLAKRGFSAEEVEGARRFFNGELAPAEVFPTMMKFGRAYYYHPNFLTLLKAMASGGARVKLRPEAQIFAFSRLLPGWTVMDRLGEIKVPTLVMAGRDDFLFPPEHQAMLAAGLPNSKLEIIDCAGHHPHEEQTGQVIEQIRRFMGTAIPGAD